MPSWQNAKLTNGDMRDTCNGMQTTEQTQAPPRRHVINVRLNDDERDALTMVAQEHGLAPSTWVRMIVRDELRRKLPGRVIR